MAEIRDTYVPNVWGEGNEKEVTLDNGDKYVVRNTYVPNIWGEGNEQEIEKVSSSGSSSGSSGIMILMGFVAGLGGIIFLIGLSMVLGGIGWGYLIGGALLALSPAAIFIGDNLISVSKEYVIFLIAMLIIEFIIIAKMFCAFFA